jgi:hypothetical protein
MSLCNNHWKVNTLVTAIYSQWYQTYDRKKHSLDNNGSSDRNNSDNDTVGGSDGPPRKRARATTVVDNDTCILELPQGGIERPFVCCASLYLCVAYSSNF